jgi:hypothetical protein
MQQTSLFGSPRGPLILERGRWPASDGLIGVVQKSSGHGRGTAITHSFAIIADVEVLSGCFYFPLPRGDVIAPRRFLMVVPPRSLVPIGHASADAAAHVSTSVGVAAKMDVGTARLLHWEGPLLTLNRAGITAALQAAPIADIAVDEGVPASMARARHYIHDCIAHPAPVRELHAGSALRLTRSRAGSVPHTRSHPRPIATAHGFRTRYCTSPPASTFWKQHCAAASMISRASTSSFAASSVPPPAAICSATSPAPSAPRQIAPSEIALSEIALSEIAKTAPRCA